MKRKLSISLLALLLLAGGGYFLFQAIKIEVKAKIAQGLLEYTWNKSLKENKSYKPWPSFDGSPILKLETGVVDVTTNGAVPVDAVDVTTFVLKFPVIFTFPPTFTS